ncbi:hypothetical protein UG54_00075 [Gordonia sihwensis]|nr:hypothetical protein UG54_00075 [Gordonia sihwensis]
MACRRADLYATAAFQRETLAEIEHLIEQNPKDQTIGRLAAQVVEGRIMDRYRREQHDLMPPLPVSADAQTYHRQLGDARFDMAHARLRMDMSQGSQSEWQEWQQRHHQAAQRAALAQARMEAVNEGGASGWTSLTREEQRARRDAVAADPSLATPVVPRRWADVVDETQDLIDGIEPVRESVDDAGYQPYGDPKPRRFAGRGSRDALAKQSRRRSRRRTGARGAWRSLQADKRRLETTMNKTEQRLDELTPSPKYDAAVFDLTLLTLITENMGRRS